MKPNPTPGPWEAKSWTDGVWAVAVVGGRLADISPVALLSAEADARLVSAAPELADALSRCMKVILKFSLGPGPSPDEAQQACDEARAALKKAGLL
jgi:hypothetical protein